jgi:hypothetical protein
MSAKIIPMTDLDIDAVEPSPAKGEITEAMIEQMLTDIFNGDIKPDDIPWLTADEIERGEFVLWMKNFWHPQFNRINSKWEHFEQAYGPHGLPLELALRRSDDFFTLFELRYHGSPPKEKERLITMLKPWWELYTANRDRIEEAVRSRTERTKAKANGRVH